MSDRHLIRRGRTHCPKCNGCKGIMGKNSTGNPATLPCDRCDGTGEVWEDNLTDIECQPKPKKFFERDDNP